MATYGVIALLFISVIVAPSHTLTFKEKADKLITDATWIDSRAKDIVDIVFVVDESGSVGPTNFGKSKTFMRNFLDYFSIAPGHSQVGVVKFGSAATNSIVLRHDNHKCAFMKQLDALKYGGGGTNAYDGISKARGMLAQFGRKATGNAFQVLIFMTDGGYTTADPTSMVNDLKNKDGVLVIVILVGHISRRDQMLGWASPDVKNNKMAFELDNFKNFADLANYLHKGTHVSKFLPINSAECNNACIKPSECKCDTLASQGVPTCVCDPGYVRTPSGSQFKCVQCPRGQYQHEINIFSTCRSCPATQTTVSAGATAASQCVCADGFWNAADHTSKPPCVAITCGRDSTLTLDKYHLMVKDTCTYKYGQKCNYACHSGYLATDIMTRECKKSGDMSPPFSACSALKCPRLPNTPESIGWSCVFDGKQQTQVFPYRTQCRNKCTSGHRNRDKTSSSVVCSIDQARSNGRWSGTALICDPITCGALPEIPNGQYNLRECSHVPSTRTFGKKCQVKCDSGFRANQDVEWECQASGTWTNMDKMVYCEDKSPPTISNCPDHIRVDNIKGTAYAKLAVAPPKSFDNYRDDEIETEMSVLFAGFKSPLNYKCDAKACGTSDMEFPIGDSTVSFTVSDRSGNKAHCSYKVTVKDVDPPTMIQCDGPDTDADGFIYSEQDYVNVQWKEPVFTDNSNGKLEIFKTSPPGEFQAGRAWTVTYTAKDQAGLTTTCDFTFKIRGIKCPELHVPVNGAMVCDKLSFGVFCVPSCQQGLTRLLPANITYTPFEYACASSGKWTPHPIVGDCAIYDPLDLTGRYEFTWFDGDCTDEAVSEKIIKSTITAIEQGATGLKGKIFGQSFNRQLVPNDFDIRCGAKNESIIQIGGAGRRAPNFF